MGGHKENRYVLYSFSKKKRYALYLLCYVFVVVQCTIHAVSCSSSQSASFWIRVWNGSLLLVTETDYKEEQSAHQQKKVIFLVTKSSRIFSNIITGQGNLNAQAILQSRRYLCGKKWWFASSVPAQFVISIAAPICCEITRNSTLFLVDSDEMA